jgi:chemotaxis protein MotB
MSDQEKKPVPESSAPGIPPWMLTYADTVTLLMTFFVMLMSFSTLDNEEYAKVRGALQGYMGVVGDTRYNRDGLLLRRNMESGRVFLEGYENPPKYDPMAYVESAFQTRVGENRMDNVLDFELTNNGFEIQIEAGDLFRSGSAEFNPDAEKVLNVISRAIRHLPHHVRVQATGDLLFLRSQGFASRQDLAVERASRVCAYLAGRKVAISRIHAATRLEPDGMVLAASAPAQVSIVVLRPGKMWML